MSLTQNWEFSGYLPLPTAQPRLGAGVTLLASGLQLDWLHQYTEMPMPGTLVANKDGNPWLLV
ncbi:hypothetical protein D3C72_1822690 [compost metagenome]